MDTIAIETIKIVSGIIGGGLAGAVLNNLIAKRNSRIQPIAKQVKISNIFIPNNLIEPHITKITFSGTTSQNFHFNNLAIAQIDVINSGNKDYVDFEFGLNFSNRTTIINSEVKGINRHHNITTKPVIDFSNPSEIIDFKLTPFNRKDKYEITLFLTNFNSTEIGEINFSSSLPIKFVDLDTFKKTFIEALKESSPLITLNF